MVKRSDKPETVWYNEPMEIKGKGIKAMNRFLQKLVVGGSILSLLLAFCAVPLQRTDARELPVFTREQICERNQWEA